MTRPTRWTRPLLTRRPPGSHTRRLLERHLAVMAVTAVVSMTALLVSYWSVQTAAGEMRTRAAPAVQLVASTQLALLRAHEEAELSADRRIDQVVGAGARYENQLSAADQGLSRLSDVQIDGERGRGVLNTASALLTSYSSSITPGAVKYVRDEDDLMQKEKFTEAETLLVRPGTGVVPRLDVLQDHQMRRMDRVSSLGTLQQSGWAVAELGLLVLAVTALSALWVLRTRCGRSRDPGCWRRCWSHSPWRSSRCGPPSTPRNGWTPPATGWSRSRNGPTTKPTWRSPSGTSPTSPPTCAAYWPPTAGRAARTTGRWAGPC